MVSPATPRTEAVAAGLENMQFGGNIGFAPRIEHFERSHISFRLIVGGDRDEDGRRACGRSFSARLGGVNSDLLT